MRCLRTVVATLCATWSCLGQPAWAQLVPLGGELQLNSYTTDGQLAPAVSVRAGGNFVVVWFSYGGDGSDTDLSGIQGQRFDASGAALGSAFEVNSYTTSFQLHPALGADVDGNFVVAWTSYGSSGSDTDGASVRARRHDAAGTAVGSEFQVNSYTTSQQYNAAVAVDPMGGFLVVWASNGDDGTDGDSFSIQGQRYGPNGLPAGGQFQVNSYTTSAQFDPEVAVDGSGDYVVVWTSSSSDGDGAGIRGRRYDVTGAPIGGEFQVNSYTTGTQTAPAVAADMAGNFVVAWLSYGGVGTDTDAQSVQAQRFDASGTLVGGQFEVNSYTTGNQTYPVVAIESGGSFVVAWSSYGSLGSDPSLSSIQAQRYDAAGAPIGTQFQVNSYTTDFQNRAAVGLDAAGNFVVAWESDGSAASDASYQSIQAQRYAAGRPIAGRKILVKDPTGIESDRGIVALAKETLTDVGATIVGDPTITGATLRVITNGMTASDETYVLDAGGWSVAGTVGFKYTGPTGLDGDPVRKVVVKRTSSGRALLKALVRGNVGTESLDVVPPDAGSDGGIILTIHGGGTYCAAFGGAAGGIEAVDHARLWKVLVPTGQGCPAP